MSHHSSKAQKTTSLKKRIVICSDGTWNTPDRPTNVVKLLRAIEPVDQAGVHQVVFYDQGVGTSNSFDRLIGGAFGKGLEQNVLDAYRFIAHNYQDGDEIYCFGFSRGAYTVRALGGMLDAIGLLPKEELHALASAYQYYRTPPTKRDAQSYAHNQRPEITMMGVWDTVGALGAPTPLLGKLTKPFVGFFNTHLSSSIKNAFHALAIDEKRGPFAPALWTGKINNDQNVEQVWFAGVHSDVGGGYKEAGLADTALVWMLQKAIRLGLECDDNYYTNEEKMNPNVLGMLHDSYSLFYRAMNKLGIKDSLRDLEGEVNNPPINISVHESVLQRLAEVDSYHPENFVESMAVSRTDERRHFARTKTQFTGSVQADSQVAACTIVDFSPLGGVQVECEEDLGLADSIAISSSKFAKTLATCAWKKGNTYGLKFAA